MPIDFSKFKKKEEVKPIQSWRFRTLIRELGLVIKLLHKKEYEKAVDKIRWIQGLCKFAMDCELEKEKRGEGK